MSFLGGGGGASFKTVSYVGDGTLDRVIPLPFTPKMVIIVDKIDNSSDCEFWFGDIDQLYIMFQSGSTFSVLGSVESPAFFAMAQNGFNVGKAHNWNGKANVTEHNLYLLVI